MGAKDMTLRSDGTMYCKGCDQHRPRGLFWKHAHGGSHHVLCSDCRKLPKKVGASAVPPVERPHRVDFIVGYGAQLFPPNVTMTGLVHVGREAAFWAGELYNANMRR